MRYRSKRYRRDYEQHTTQPLRIDEAIRRLKSYSRTKFDQSVDIVCVLGIDPKQADQMIRGSVSLPRGIGSTKRVIAFCQESDVPAARAAGAVEAGADELVERISKGWLDFDVAIAHPSLMGKISKLGRVLGPQGKMPSPKSGTVTADVAQAVREYSAGKVEFRNDAGGNVHAVVGKLSFEDEALKENITAFVEHVRRLRPASAKGQYLRKVCISGTMTPSVTLDVAAVAAE
jgi:large subunit ribosomal protein L1